VVKKRPKEKIGGGRRAISRKTSKNRKNTIKMSSAERRTILRGSGKLEEVAKTDRTRHHEGTDPCCRQVQDKQLTHDFRFKCVRKEGFRKSQGGV